MITVDQASELYNAVLEKKTFHSDVVRRAQAGMAGLFAHTSGWTENELADYCNGALDESQVRSFCEFLDTLRPC